MSSQTHWVLAGVLIASVSWADHPLATERDRAIETYLAQKYPARIERVSVDQQRVRVSGRLSRQDASAQLAERLPHESTVAAVLDRRMPLRVEADGRFDVEMPRFLEGRDRLYSRWVVADDQGQPQSHAVWATEVAGAAKHPDLPPVRVDSIKGLNGIHPDPQLLPDLAELGVRHITVNINLGGLLAPQAEDDTIAFDHAGTTLHVRRRGLSAHDRVMQFAHQHGMAVVAILLVPRLDRQVITGRLLTHPEAKDGHYSMANVATAEGAVTYAACVAFLAERYGQPNAAFGRITTWIVHNEVDAGWVWTNAGEKGPYAFMDDYVRAMRLTHFAARQNDPNARVFISLTHSWAESHQPNNPRFYAGRNLLEILQAYGRAEGDFNWGIAYHPYPQDLGRPETWQDAKAQMNLDTPYITFRNIEVLDAWVKRPENQFSGRPRVIHLSEQGFHSRNNNESNQAIQAAALAYAWNKIKTLDSIQAFHYHRWIDHEREGGLHLGLWTVRPGSITMPEHKKQSWFVFQSLGTDREEQVTAFALPIIGASQWSEVRQASEISEK